MLSPDRPQKGELLDNDGLPLTMKAPVVTDLAHTPRTGHLQSTDAIHRDLHKGRK